MSLINVMYVLLLLNVLLFFLNNYYIYQLSTSYSAIKYFNFLEKETLID